MSTDTSLDPWSFKVLTEKLKWICLLGRYIKMCDHVGTPGTRLGNSFESSSQIMLGPNTVVPPLNSPFGTGNSQHITNTLT